MRLQTGCAILGCVAVIASPVLAQSAYNRALAYDGTPESAARIRSEVADQLRDPPSAYFRDVRAIRPAVRDDSPLVICGRVQGRNGYGGMGQHQGFFYTDKPTLVPATAMGDAIWASFCGTDAPVIETLKWNAPPVTP